LKEVKEYVRCPEYELDGIRIKEMSCDEVQKNAWFVWERNLKRGSS
jgi:hypothetical protein